MKRIFSTLAATLCLLTLFVSSAACMAVPALQVMAAMDTSSSVTLSAPGHECCPAHAPFQEHTTVSCCTVHHLPAVASDGDPLNLMLDIGSIPQQATLLAGASVAPPATSKTGPPPRRPAPALRI